MAGITVAEVWRLVLPEGSELVAGKAGLGREVTWVAMLRARPPAFESLKGGELALISTEALRLLDPQLSLPRVIRSLAEMEVAAVAVRGEIPPEGPPLAEALGLPLFTLPAGSSLAETERTITRLIADRRTELYQRGQEIYRQLTELAIEGRGVPAILERLVKITGLAAALEDEAFRLCLYTAPPALAWEQTELAPALQEGQAHIRDWLKRAPLSASEPPTALFDLPRPAWARAVAPIVAKEGVLGYLSLLGPSEALDELGRLAASRAAAACAIELVKERAILQAQDQMQAHFVDDLLSGNYASAQAFMDRAQRLGYDLSRPHAVLAMSCRYPSRRGRPPPAEAPSAPPPPDLEELMERELARRRVRAPFRGRGDTITLIYPVDADTDEKALKRLAEELRAALAARAVGATVSLGLGRLHPGLEGLALAHREAEQALGLGQRLFGEGQVTYFGDLGLYRLLFSMHASDEVRTFHQEMLGALAEYDQKNNTELLKTLEAYFASLGSPTEAAQRLHLHRNTLLYRLRRIREITGLDLNDPEARLALHLALRVRQTLQATGQNP